MEPIKVFTGKAAVMNRKNVDTDQIIPKQFLKRIERSGFGQFLFTTGVLMKKARNAQISN